MLENRFVLALSQFLHTRLLLRLQCGTVHTGRAAEIPPSNGLDVRTWATCAALISIFEGTQPILTQVPPVVPRSTIATSAPSSWRRIAAAKAAPPLPITATLSAFDCGVAQQSSSSMAAPIFENQFLEPITSPFLPG